MPPHRVSRRHFHLPLAVLLLLPALAASAALDAAPRPHCGTGLWMERPLESRGLAKRTATRARAAFLPYRTLETTHFLIHYALRGIHRAKRVAGDEGFDSTVDSLYAGLPTGLSERARDSAVIALLDARDAGHPRYVSAMAGHFESAYLYYVDTLGMRPPTETANSIFYEAPASAKGKFPVDIADIGEADPSFRGQEIYALTYPTGYGGMLMENDFLFRSELGPGGIPVGDSISSRYQGKLVHNYAAEWDMGLKVTCYHELYHGVQFAYTPKETRFHLWYETSATGMEERKAPEVNDYLQYLPAFMSDLADKGMLGFVEGGLSRYGNGIYHVYLAKELGEDFDVRLWQRLATNGNKLEAALESVHGTYGKTVAESFARFAAQLAFAGSDAKNSLPAYSPDLPLWPRLHRDSIDLAAPASWSSNRRHPPLSIRALALGNSGRSGKALFQPDTLLRIVLARLRPDSSRVDILRGRIAPLDIAGNGGETLAALANGSLSLISGGVEVRLQASRSDTVVYPYPNPLNRSGGETELTFSRLPRDAEVSIFSESGTPLRTLGFDSTQTLWAWDLLDARGLKVKPGLYWFRVDAGDLKPLYIR